MPYKYVGRTNSFKGKTLWEIVGNLKNFGVGRFIIRNRFFGRYPEPTFMKILRVETLPEPKEKSLDNVRKVKVLVESTFRGRIHPKPILIESASYKADYILIAKAEEEQFYTKPLEIKSAEKILPKTMNIPPLLRELFIREMKIKGETVTEPMMEIIYNPSIVRRYKIAQEGEVPTVEYIIGLGKPAAPNLYEGIKV